VLGELEHRLDIERGAGTAAGSLGGRLPVRDYRQLQD
jgi:hypothetical protein